MNPVMSYSLRRFSFLSILQLLIISSAENVSSSGSRKIGFNEKYNCATEIYLMSERINLLEHQVSLLLSKNEKQEKDVELIKKNMDLVTEKKYEKTQDFSSLGKRPNRKTSKRSAEANDSREPFWSKAQLSSLELRYMPYDNHGINIYTHPKNAQIGNSEKEFYYAPMSQLLQKSAKASYNSVTKQHEVTFGIQMWTEEIEDQVRKYTEKLVQHPIEPGKIRVLPIEKVRLTSLVHPVKLSVWIDFKQHQVLFFKFACQNFDTCQQLASEIRSSPQQFNDLLRLEFTTSTHTLRSQEIAIKMDALADGLFMSKFTQRFPESRNIFLTAEDEQGLLNECKEHIIISSIGDLIILEPQSEEKIGDFLKNLLIESRAKITSDHGEDMWESVFWREENYRPDKAVKVVNEMFRKLNETSGDELSNCLKDDSKVACNASAQLIGTLAKQNSISKEQLDIILKESKGNIIWNGREFITKPVLVSKLNMARLRDVKSLPDKKTIISYSKVMLSTVVNIQPNYKEEERNQILLLRSKLEDLHEKINTAVPKEMKARSCFELKVKNPRANSGIYFIDPDGQMGGDLPIQVYCNMTSQTTSIFHDTETKTNITACLDPGCYTKAITYNATARQISKLIDISASCKQHFRFDSTGVPLEYKNTQYGFWNDRNNKKQIFWAGPATDQHTCQCGIQNNCVERSYKCNVDSLVPLNLVDEGFITATELLPVTRLSFGRTSLTGVKASYTLGRFECTGQVAISSKPSNCQDLFKMGHTLSGFYDVKGSSNQIASTYCDFSKSSTETGYETRYGLSVKSSPVHFFVTRLTSWNTPGTMPFEKEYLNLGGGLNLASGVFTAPKAGIYAFSFKGNGYGSDSNYAGRGGVFLERNGASVAFGYSRIYGATSGTSASLSVHGTLKLNKGDRITIRLSSGTLTSNNDSFTEFTGSLLEEELVIS